MSGSAPYAVDLDLLAGAVAALDRCATRCDELLDAVAGRVDRLQDTWSGLTADAQLDAQRRWAAGFAQMRDGLDDMRRAASTARVELQRGRRGQRADVVAVSRIEVDGRGYATTSARLGDGNRSAAVDVRTLSDALAGTGAMAGDSSFASDFARSYDAAAAATIATFDDVVGALGSMCRLAFLSLENHVHAELSSIVSTVTVSSAPSVFAATLYESMTPVPPPSLGGDPSSLPGWANVILDHVEGFVWPDADLDRLHAAAGAWRTAGGQLAELAMVVMGTVVDLLEERSPEIALARDALTELSGTVHDLAMACDELAAFCEEYAAAVERQREAILELVADLIRDAIIIAAAGFVLGVFTGGGGNAVAAWLNAGKLASEVPKFHAFIEALRASAAVSAMGLDGTAAMAMTVQGKVGKFVLAPSVAAPTSSTTISLTKVSPTFLRLHEGGPMGAHTLGKHVGKSIEWLNLRLHYFPKLTRVLDVLRRGDSSGVSQDRSAR